MRAVSKLLADCAKEGKAACGSNQLCAGLEAGIEGAIHSVRKKAYEDRSMDFKECEIDDDLWQATAEAGETPPQDPTGEESFQDAVESVEDLKDPFLLVLADADTGFNNLSHLNMLWDVRHC
jgi:hypothetical protein